MRDNKDYTIIIRLCITILLVSVMVCSRDECMLIAAEVEELPQDIKDEGDGVVKLIVYVVDQNGNEYYVRQGTGILIGAEDEKRVLTSDSLIQIDEDLKNNIRRQFGLSTESELNVTVDVALQVGTRIKTQVGNSGSDFVVLDLDSNVAGMSGCRLGNSAQVKENDKLFILGYGGSCDILGQKELGNFAIQGNVIAVTSVTKEEIITDYQPVSGNIGAPVLNRAGDVVGILVMKDSELYIKPIDILKTILDVLGIAYQKAGVGNHYNEVTDEIRAELNKHLLECEELAVQDNEYTSKSIERLKAVIAETIALTTNPSATYDDYKKAIDELDKYENKLRKREYPIRMAQIGMGIAILVFAVLGIRMQKEIKEIREEGNWNIGEDEVTSVYAKLIRMDTLQEIPISNVIFRIGQRAEGMDYVVEDNTSVSRHHADIMRRGDDYFILDNNSTNYTYVNERRALPGEYIPIKTGDIIRLSNVSFRFEI